MKPDMLKSQFAALEEPSPANTAIISIDNNVVAIVEEILRYTDAHN